MPFKGWKTLSFGLVMVVVPPVLTFLGAIDWGNSGLPSWAVSLIGMAVIGLRAATSTPLGKAGP